MVPEHHSKFLLYNVSPELKKIAYNVNLQKIETQYFNNLYFENNSEKTYFKKNKSAINTSITYVIHTISHY